MRLGRSLAALAQWYDVELTWSSNAIEGNTLSRSETAIILEKGLTIGGKPLKDHLEALGHRDSPTCRRSPGRKAVGPRGDFRSSYRASPSRSNRRSLRRLA